MEEQVTDKLNGIEVFRKRVIQTKPFVYAKSQLFFENCFSKPQNGVDDKQVFYRNRQNVKRRRPVLLITHKAREGKLVNPFLKFLV